MDKFLQIVGAVGVCLVLLVVIISIFSTRGGTAAALVLVASLPWALPSIVGFVMIAAFGYMLGQLKAIRVASERQTEIMDQFIRLVTK